MSTDDYTPDTPPQTTPPPCDGQPWRPDDHGGIECLTLDVPTPTPTPHTNLPPTGGTIDPLTAFSGGMLIVLGVILIRDKIRQHKKES